VVGLAKPAMNAQGFVAFSNAVFRSQRIAALLTR